ncbi:uncharacterized protein BJ212DRAFT_1483693 [Suillus subaureus]|uniref:Uncharacterized protein n=1 Tax=Suillus subaureus TaxID=48587 RepID=A0A9P7JAS5_9AGAM|nr:uncharacterized protein BJ212DRAFT_1483693 [Suillus subaureus]KAG1811447.1 hypothetical protein BJ212DRAFT_1483693 [Suillus subaureus]
MPLISSPMNNSFERHSSRAVISSNELKKPAHQAPSATRSRCHEAVNDNQDPPTCMSFAAKFGDHEAQDIYNLTLWAKKIFLAEATYDKPPEMAAFDHVPKKFIHVHIPTKEALSDAGDHHQVNTSQGFATTFLCHDEDDEFITYPPITDILHEMDVMMPLLHMSQYKDDLLNHGVTYVNNVIGLSDEFFVDVVGMPMGVIQSFLKVTH